MKRFAVLALLAAFILGTVGVAQAVELKVSGTWRVQFNHINNADFDDRGVTAADKFAAMQRMRTTFEFIANENLRGVLQLEIGDLTWGRGIGGAIGTDGINIETRHAFINFTVPNTAVDVRAGLQAVALPSTLGSHILAADVGALTAHVPFNDMVGLTMGWARPFDVAADARTAGRLHDDEVDVFYGVLPVRLEGARLNPFIAITRIGRDPHPVLDLPALADTATMWHTGLNFRVDMWDPIRILGDLNYGTVELDRVAPAPDLEQSGWIGLLAVQYAMDMVTPRIFGVYESGEDANFLLPANNKSDRMPVINTDGGAFGPGVGLGTRTAFAGSNYLRALLDDFDPMAFQAGQGAVGLWALGFALLDIKSMDKLSHEFVTYYARGTNHRNNWNLLTTEDSYREVNLNTTYQMYENLAIILELAYGKVELDGLTGAAAADRRAAIPNMADDAMTRGVLGMVYRF